MFGKKLEGLVSIFDNEIPSSGRGKSILFYFIKFADSFLFFLIA